jgi:hypothetical protein
VADAPTILAIAVPGAVSALAIAGNVYVSRSSARDTRTLADIESSRALLDEAAQLFHEVGYAVDEAISEYLAHHDAFRSDPDKGSTQFERVEQLGQESDRMSVRLNTRLGPEHPAAVEFKEATGCVLSIYRDLVRAPRLAKRDEDADLWEKMDASRNMFRDRAEAFVKAAHKAAGAQLPRD